MLSKLPRLALLTVLIAGMLWTGARIASADVSPAEQTAMLTATNTLRRNVAASETRRLGQTVTIPDLTWNAAVAAAAQGWANHIAATGSLDHNESRGDLGENLYMESGSSATGSGDRAFQAWAAEASGYKWDTNSCTDVCGHYTQLVWAATTSIGCGKATAGANTYWVCNFAPPGNFNGQRPYEPSGSPAPSAGNPGSANPAPAGSTTVTYAAGWNIVAGPSGATFSQAAGALNTLQAGDSDYETLAAGAPVAAGRGYWAFFSRPVTMTLGGSSAGSVSLSAPAGQWILVGNPSATAPATVRGADLVYLWDPAANQYSQTNVLPVGRGAWVYSFTGATVTVGP